MQYERVQFEIEPGKIHWAAGEGWHTIVLKNISSTLAMQAILAGIKKLLAAYQE